MSVPGPVKPPRGIKLSKDGGENRLMTVIRALSASETNEQREIEKAKLEKEYKKSDQRLDELVSLHDQDLTEVMQMFSTLSERVTAAREKVHGVKENLNACKQLLRCRRDELMKLWLENVEHKYVLQHLNDVDQLRSVPSRLTHYFDKKMYLHATKLLVSTFTVGGGALQNVEGLREVRMELETRKQELNLKLLKELGKQLYIESTREMTSFKRQGSNRDFQRGNEVRSSRGNKNKRNLLDAIPPFPGVQGQRNAVNSIDLNNLVEDEDVINPEENSENFIAILIECLALLNKIPEAIEIIKAQMQGKLLCIATKISEQIKNETKLAIPASSGEKCEVDIKIDNQQSPLVKLLQAIFTEFRSVAGVHSIALRSLSHVTKKYNISVQLHDMADVWNKIQAVIQIILSDYLDIQNIADGMYEVPTTLNEGSVDVNAFFRKKPQRQKVGPLFKFESSSQPIVLNSYLKEHRYSSLTLTEPAPVLTMKTLVCEPDPKNITLIFRPMMQFIDEIEKSLGCTPNNPCALNSFIADYVKEVYLGGHHILVATAIEKATKGPEAWRIMTSTEHMRDLGLSRPLLESTVKVQQCVSELRTLMIDLPLQGEHFCTLALNVLHNYRETCQIAYRAIVQPNGDDKRICSATWLKDDDISRFIKSLPNWESLKNETFHAPVLAKLNRRRMAQRQETVDEESPEDVRQRNIREAEILASTLGEGGINASEIIPDIDQLRSLALIQESVEWFSMSVKSFVLELRQSKVAEETVLPSMPEPLIDSMEQVANEFDELANTCILLLHLEVRVQCFHYLRPRREYNNLSGAIKDQEDADPRVEELSRVLQQIDESLQITLHPKKTKYIFEGLGHLIAKILITSAQYIEKIDDSGIRRMCRNVFTLQQTLTNITMTRELALDYARQYFELFYESPEEILNGVLEHGPQFSELEYMNAFQLIARSKQEFGSVNKYLEKLSEILGEVGVTV